MKLAVVTSGFPRRSETFLLNELLALDELGALGPIFALKRGDGLPPHPGADRLLPRVRFVEPGPPALRALRLARELATARVTGVHAYFAHAPAEVTAAAAARVGIPYGFSAHALDVRKVGRPALRRRARAARCVVACNLDVADELAAVGAAPILLPHGVDLARFRSAPKPARGRLELLAVGRLVPKKGFDVLVDAVARLRRPFRLRIIGDGPERERLARRIAAARLDSCVTLERALTHAELPASYAAADIVVVPSVRDARGDRDGLPNVALEALASERAVIASDIAAVGTAVRHTRTGLLVAPGDPAGLAAAIELLAADSGLRARLAAAGRKLVERSFDLGACTRRLIDFLEAAYA